MASGATSRSRYHRPAGKTSAVVMAADAARPPPSFAAGLAAAAIGCASLGPSGADLRLELLPDVDPLLVARRVDRAFEVLHHVLRREDRRVVEHLGGDELVCLVVGRAVAGEVRLLRLDL